MQKKVRNNIIKAASITLAVILVCIGGFLLYVSDYYHADETAQAVAKEGYVTNTEEGDYVISPQSGLERPVGVIFYPGAKVETKAYLPLLSRLREMGVTCFLMEMPLRFAFFRVDAAEQVIEDNPQIEHWYIAGHSLGGAMASQYAFDNQDKLDGLILLGAYPYKEYPVEKTLTIYGSLDTSVAEKLDYTENVHVIEGGNHAQFGNYGEQSGDAEATISAEAQQTITVSYIMTFIMQQSMLP